MVFENELTAGKTAGSKKTMSSRTVLNNVVRFVGEPEPKVMSEAFQLVGDGREWNTPVFNVPVKICVRDLRHPYSCIADNKPIRLNVNQENKWILDVGDGIATDGRHFAIRVPKGVPVF